MANSSMLVLPSMTVPASLSFANDGRVVGRDELVEHARAAGGAQAPRYRKMSLCANGNSGERTCAACGKPGIRRTRACQRRFVRDRDEGIQLVRVRIDARKVELRQLDAREFARLQTRGKLGECLLVETHSMTFGTRYSPLRPAAHSPDSRSWRILFGDNSARNRCDRPATDAPLGGTSFVAARSNSATKIEDAAQIVL